MLSAKFIRRHPLAVYYALTFLLSWGVVVYTVVVGRGGGFPATPKEAEQDLLLIVVATLTGPSFSSVLLTLIFYGSTGLKERITQKLAGLRGRQQRGNDDKNWWYKDPLRVVLLTPATISAILAFLCITVSSELYRPTILTDPDKIGRVLIGLGYGTAAGFFEEVGWSGWAVPEAKKQYGSSLIVGLQVGLAWGSWHFLVAVWGSGGPNGEFDLDKFLPWIPWNLIVLPCYRVFMVYLYDFNDSILVMALLHGSLTASLPLILMPSATGMALFHFYILFGLILLVALLGIELARANNAKAPTVAVASKRNRIYAALLMTGASVVAYRAVSMIANGYLSILVPWVAASIVLELCFDVACFLTCTPWLIFGDSSRDSMPLQIGAVSTMVHAVRVLVFAMGRCDTRWKDFDVRVEHQAVHGGPGNLAQVYFASFMSLASLVVLVKIQRWRANNLKRDKVE